MTNTIIFGSQRKRDGVCFGNGRYTLTYVDNYLNGTDMSNVQTLDPYSTKIPFYKQVNRQKPKNLALSIKWTKKRSYVGQFILATTALSKVGHISTRCGTNFFCPSSTYNNETNGRLIRYNFLGRKLYDEICEFYVLWRGEILCFDDNNLWILYGFVGKCAKSDR